MGRQITLSKIGNTTKVYIIDNGVAKTISSNSNRDLVLFSEGVKVLNDPNETVLNNFYISLSELTDSFGATTPEELIDALASEKIFVVSGGGAGGNVEAGTTAPIVVALSNGKTVGRFENGETIPVHTNLQELMEDIARELTHAEFILPVNGYFATSFIETEVGTPVNRTFSNNFAQNDGGAIVSERIYKDGVKVSDTGTFTETIPLTLIGISYRGEVSYNAGTVKKENSLGDLEDNTIAAGVADSGTRILRGYNPIFFGTSVVKKTSSSQIRTLNKRLTNTGNLWDLETGNTHKIFQFWLPNDKNLISVIDIDALGSDITSSYQGETQIINNVGGDPVTGTLYTKTADVAYGTSHRHKIRIS